jgi:hypothetical protein
MEYSLSVTVDRDFLLSRNEALAPEVCQGALGGDMLCVVDHWIAVLVPLNLIDFSGDVEGSRSFASGFVSLDDAQAFALYPTKSSRH